jgi:hypothetical protein
VCSSIDILERHLTLVCAAKEMSDTPPPKGFIVAALDLLAALCEALEGSFEAFLAADRAKLVPMVVACCQVPPHRAICALSSVGVCHGLPLVCVFQDSAPDVQQSGYALLGDLARYAMRHVAPSIAMVIPHLLESMSVITSACEQRRLLFT